MFPVVNIFTSLFNWIAPPGETDSSDGALTSLPGNPIPIGSLARKEPYTGKFAVIRRSVEQRLEQLLRVEITEHLSIAPKDVLELHYIQIQTTQEQGEELLQLFFSEFTPAARQDWIRHRLGNVAQISLESFSGVFGNFELLESTDHLDKHEEMLQMGLQPVYQVHIYSRWVQKKVKEPSLPKLSEGIPLALTIQDADGSRQERFTDYPVQMGRGGQSRVVVNGRYVSTEHCVIRYQGKSLVLEDQSRNGTWVDGQQITKGEPFALLKSRYSLKLGKNQGSHNDCPEILLELPNSNFAASNNITSATPVALTMATPLPLPDIQHAEKPVAVLEIWDTTGKHYQNVHELPFTIGRHSHSNYVVPAGHVGVSGEHLVIERITSEGAEVLNRAVEKNGTSLGGTLQTHRFFWQFDNDIRLAPRWLKDPEVVIVLKRQD